MEMTQGIHTVMPHGSTIFMQQFKKKKKKSNLSRYALVNITLSLCHKIINKHESAQSQWLALRRIRYNISQGKI